MIFFRRRQRPESERRYRERVPFHRSVMIFVPSIAATEGEGYLEARGRNICEGGILMESKRNYPVLVPCRVKFAVQNRPDGFELDGMIVWTQEIKEHGSWEVGVNFVNMRDEDRLTLNKMMRETGY